MAVFLPRISCVLLLLNLLCGCSFAGLGLKGDFARITLGYDSCNEELGRFRQIVLGLDVSLEFEHGRFNVGRSELRVLTPIERGEKDASSDSKDIASPDSENTASPDSEKGCGFQFPFAVTWVDEENTTHRFGLMHGPLPRHDDTCDFRHSILWGAGVNFSRSVKGGGVGLMSRTLLRVLPDTDHFYKLDYMGTEFRDSTLERLHNLKDFKEEIGGFGR